MVIDYENMTADEIRVARSEISNYLAYDDAELLRQFARGDAKFICSLTKTTIWELDGKRFVVHGGMISDCDAMYGDAMTGQFKPVPGP